ncbi:MAG: peptidoglycan-binding protein, partial [Mameliella sp.]|nr:peptidoglycan-binding protein [Mameliella sp.]
RSHLGKVEFLDVGVLSNSPLYRFFFFPPDMPIRDIPERPGMSDGQFFEALAGARPMPAPDTPRAEAPPPTATPAALIAPLATEADEARLNLDRAARQEIQRRLTLAGFDTGGVDGDLGPNSRRAIRDWQQARGFPASGHLNASQRARLIEDSRELYDGWLAEEQAKPRKRRVKVCQRGALGLLVNCRMEWR